MQPYVNRVSFIKSKEGVRQGNIISAEASLVRHSLVVHHPTGLIIDCYNVHSKRSYANTVPPAIKPLQKLFSMGYTTRSLDNKVIGGPIKASVVPR